MLELINLTKTYGRLTAVDNLSLTVKTGELFGFLGPNGAGKTTTLKLLVGLLKPTAGEVVLFGRKLAQDPVGLKHLIGFVPDTPFLYDKLTGREFLRFVAGVYQMDQRTAERNIGRYLELFELEELADALIEGYSHGMKQKLVMSSALIHAPKLLVIDEPMVGLDPRSAVIVKKILRKVVADGVTVFLSTHTLGVAEQLCDRIGIIQRGRLRTVGEMAQLRAQASNPALDLESIFLEVTEADTTMETIIETLKST